VTVNRWWLAALPALALIGYGFGRYASPAKVEVQTKIEERIVIHNVEVEKIVKGPVTTVTRTVERLVPCTEGALTPTTDTTTTVSEGPVTIDRVETADGTSSTTTQSKTVTIWTQPRLMLQAGASAGLDLKPAWNVGASYRIIGPVWLGAAYRSEKQVELRASLTF
jgi:hypothetical protein